MGSQQLNYANLFQDKENREDTYTGSRRKKDQEEYSEQFP